MHVLIYLPTHEAVLPLAHFKTEETEAWGSHCLYQGIILLARDGSGMEIQALLFLVSMIWFVVFCCLFDVILFNAQLVSVHYIKAFQEIQRSKRHISARGAYGIIG
jgi:uncharacterized membrane protein